MVNIKNDDRKTKILTSEALDRSESYPSCTIIAPSGSGKTTLTNSIINKNMGQSLAIGIGEKNQTTLISTNYILDSRILNDKQFSMKIIIQEFDSKKILINLREHILKKFIEFGYIASDTIESLDEVWIDNVLEPVDSSYHLGSIKESIDINWLKESLLSILEKIEYVDGVSFADYIKDEKKKSASIKMPELRSREFEKLWDEQDDDTISGLIKWFEHLEAIIYKELTDITLTEINQDREIVLNDIELDDKSKLMLKALYNPTKTYSLIVKEIKISCRPHKKLIDLFSKEKFPFRFCIRDTIGLTQTGIDDDSIGKYLEAGLNHRSDSLLILLSLEERNDVLNKSCKLISEKLKRINKSEIPIHVLFTKVDKIIETKVTLNSNGLILEQQDFDNQIKSIIEEINNEVDEIVSSIQGCKTKWLSMRYRDEAIDPIQIALEKKDLNDGLIRFKPEGLYQYISEIVQDIQTYILPKDITEPLILSINNFKLPPVAIKIHQEKINYVLDEIQQKLTEELKYVNTYLITTEKKIHGNSVVAYWEKLGLGLGHTTRASMYGNFNINMKGLLDNVLKSCLININQLYESNAISTICENLSEEELVGLLGYLTKGKDIKNQAFDGFNVDLISKIGDRNKNTQMIHAEFKNYFDDPKRYHFIIGRVASQLSYENKHINDLISAAYKERYSYDYSIRNVQGCFKNIFKSEEFRKIVSEEFGNAMTNILNKLFISV